jgi:hypothetical protein
MRTARSRPGWARFSSSMAASMAGAGAVREAPQAAQRGMGGVYGRRRRKMLRKHRDQERPHGGQPGQPSRAPGWARHLSAHRYRGVDAPVGAAPGGDGRRPGPARGAGRRGRGRPRRAPHQDPRRGRLDRVGVRAGQRRGRRGPGHAAVARRKGLAGWPRPPDPGGAAHRRGRAARWRLLRPDPQPRRPAAGARTGRAGAAVQGHRRASGRPAAGRGPPGRRGRPPPAGGCPGPRTSSRWSIPSSPPRRRR